MYFWPNNSDVGEEIDNDDWVSDKYFNFRPKNKKTKWRLFRGYIVDLPTLDRRSQRPDRRRMLQKENSRRQLRISARAATHEADFCD